MKLNTVLSVVLVAAIIFMGLFLASGDKLTGLTIAHGDIATETSPQTALEENTGLNTAIETPQQQFLFVENKGQYPEEVLFSAQTSSGAFFFLQDKLVMNLKDYVLFLHIGQAASVEGQEKAQAEFNYMKGNDPEEWQQKVSSYRTLKYNQIFEGIDFYFTGSDGALKYTFLAQPGTDISRIKFVYEGAESLSINENGDLEINFAGKKLVDSRPSAWQVIDGEKVLVEISYRLIDELGYGFEVGDYDPEYGVVIDPTLEYSSYLGGTNAEHIRAIAVDDEGFAYVTGHTASSDFPVTPGVINETNASTTDLFVTKFNQDGSELIYSTYLGGSGAEYSYGLAVDKAGNAYIVGDTSSSDFPVSPHARNTSIGGSTDIFVTKLNKDATDIIYSTYLGGACASEGAYAVDVDVQGYAYIVGYSACSDYPTTEGVINETHSGESLDIVVTKLNKGGTGLVWSTFLGPHRGFGIFVDDQGYVYVTGDATASFTTTSGVFNETFNGGTSDAFLAKLNPDARSFNYSTFIGGNSQDDIGYAVAVDYEGNAYVTGILEHGSFPTTEGAFQTNYLGTPGEPMAFVSKFNQDASALIYSSYLGGSDNDFGFDMALMGNDAVVTGRTYSSDFPVSPDAYRSSRNGSTDLFLTKFNSDGSGVTYSTYLGGSSNEGIIYGGGIAVLGTSVFLSGSSISSDFPVTAGANQTSNAGSYDATISKFSGFSITPSDNVVVKTDISLKNGTYYVNDTEGDGIFIVKKKGVTISCDGTIIIGNGSGIGVSAMDTVNIEGCEFRNFQNALKGNKNPEYFDLFYNWSSGDNVISSIIRNSKGEYYICGYDQSAGDYDWRILKTDKYGNQLWNRTYRWSSGDDYIVNAEIDSQDNVVFVGSKYVPFSSRHEWTILFLNGTDDTQIWNKSFAITTQIDRARDAAFDSAGDIIVVGQYEAVPVNDAPDWMIKKLNRTNGDEIWSKSYGWDTNTQYEIPYGVVVDSLDEITIAGASDYVCYPFACVEWRVLKTNSTGDEVWNKSIRWYNTTMTPSAGIALDSEENPVVAGVARLSSSVEDFGVIKLQKEDGAQIWNSTLDFGEDDESAYSMVLDSSDNAILGGYAGPGLDWSWAIAKVDADGNEVWQRTINFTALRDSLSKIALDSDNAIIAGGKQRKPGGGVNDDWRIIKLTPEGEFHDPVVNVSDSVFRGSHTGLVMENIRAGSIFNNDFIFNGGSSCGLNLTNAVNYTIYNNTFAHNDIGVCLFNSTGNQFYHNNFTNNTEGQAISDIEGNNFSHYVPYGDANISGTSEEIDTSFLGAVGLYVADVDSDGDSDVVATARDADDVAWWNNTDGNGTFSKHVINSSFDGATNVFVADMDRDGDMDIVGAADDAADVVWWENDGSESFTQHMINSSFGTGAFGLFVIDMDSDDDNDIVGGSFNPATIVWWENDGTGTFTQNMIDSGQSYPIDIYAADIDSDNDIDIAAAIYTDGDFLWWENDGTEQFTRHSLNTSMESARSVFIADVDSDSDMDVVGTSYSLGDVVWWENDGSETFTQHAINSSMSGPWQVFVKDIDFDGDQDIAGTILGQQDFVWWENDGSESFTQHLIEGSKTGAWGVYVANIDDDVDMDIIGTVDTLGDVIFWRNYQLHRWEGNYWDDIDANNILIGDLDSDSFGESGPEYPYNKVNRGNVSDYVADYGPMGDGDADNDGDPDATDCSPFNASILSPRDTLNVSSDIILCPGLFNLADVDNDGIINIVANDVTVTCNGTWLNGTGTNRSFYSSARNGTTLIGCNVSNYDQGVFFGNNWYSSIVGFNAWTGSRGIYVYNSEHINVNSTRFWDYTTAMLVRISEYVDVFNSSMMNCSTGLSYFDDINHSFVTNSTFAYNDDAGVKVLSRSTNNTFYYNNFTGNGNYHVRATADGNMFSRYTVFGDAVFGSISSILDSFTSVNSITGGDIDNDGDVDVVVTAGGTVDDLAWFENDGSESFTLQTIDGSFDGANDAVIVDLDQDGNVDVVACASTANDIHWWENDGAESFTEHSIDDDFAGVRNIDVGDVNDDSYLDVAGASSDGISWWENDGAESFTERIVNSTFGLAKDVFIVDLDSDGDKDLVGSSSLNGIYWWENDGSESFTQKAINSTIVDIYNLHTGDLNNDGNIDIAATSLNLNQVIWWENDGSETFTQHILNDTFENARGIYIADIDSDNDYDIVAAAYTSDSFAWWENDGTGTFTQKILDSINGAEDVFVVDLDSDGDQDVLGCAAASVDVFWWQNDQPQAYRGNYWDDIFINDLRILDTSGGSQDGYGDAGTDYPYNETNGGNVSGYVNDYGPVSGSDWDGDNSTDDVDCGPYNTSVLTPRDNLYVNSNITLCPGTYYINDSLPKGVVIVNKSNVIINCNDTVLVGEDTSDNKYGFFSIGNDSVTLTGCNVTGYNNGIRFEYSNMHNLTDLGLVNSSLYGLALVNSNYSHVDDVVSYNATLGLSYSYGSSISNLVSTHANAGMFILYVYDLVLRDMNLSDFHEESTAWGIYIALSENVSIENMNIWDAETGLILAGLYNSTVNDINVWNVSDGIFFWQSDSVNITNSTFNNTLDINSTNSSNCTFYLNYFYGGGVYDDAQNNSYCYNTTGQELGNFYKYTISSSNIGWNDCGPTDVVVPDGGESYEIGDTINIQWTNQTVWSDDSVTYSLEYSDDGGSSWDTIVSYISGNNYSWDTLSLSESNTYLVRISPNNTVTKATTAESDSNFTIAYGLTTVNITYPEGVYELAGLNVQNVTQDTFFLNFSNLNLAAGDELECIIYTASNSTHAHEIRELNRTFPGGLSGGAASLNYTLQPGDIDGSYNNSWFVNNCSIKDSLGVVKNDLSVTNRPIYVKTTEWYQDVAGKNIAVDAANAYQAYNFYLRWYFSHNESLSTDVDFAFNKFLGEQFEFYCYDNQDNEDTPDGLIDSNDPDCQTIFYPAISGIQPNQGEGGFGTFGATGEGDEGEYAAQSQPDSPCFGNICNFTIGSSPATTIYYTQEVDPAGSLKVFYSTTVSNDIVAMSLESIGATKFSMSDENTSLYNASAATGLKYKIMLPSGYGVQGSSRPNGASSETFTGSLSQVMNVSGFGTSEDNFTMNFDVYIGSGKGNRNFTIYVDSGEPSNNIESDANLNRTITEVLFGTTRGNNSCADGVNNDLDYDGTDCRDPDCNGVQIGVTAGADAISCEYATELTCWDGYDNDHDGYVDCDDADCNGSIGAYYSGATPVKQNTGSGSVAYCENNAINDGNGYLYEGSFYYSASLSSCNDSFDNDANSNAYTAFTCSSASQCRSRVIDCYDTYSCWGRNASNSSLGGICPRFEDECDDGIDNDYDYGLSSSGWLGYTIYHPTASAGNNTDCYDYDCQGLASCPTNESANAAWCFDNIDNDLDKYYWSGAAYAEDTSTGIDCADPDCLLVADPDNPSDKCVPQEFNFTAGYQYCNDGKDNDESASDNFLYLIGYSPDKGDAEDLDCWRQFGACGPSPDVENITFDACIDGVDNDHDDGYNFSGDSDYQYEGTDCEDSDCLGELATYFGTTCVAAGNENTASLCTDGVDNDGDGSADLADTDCNNTATSDGTLYTAEGVTDASCNDDFDNDDDGLVDCADSGCFGVGTCNAVDWTTGSLTTVPDFTSWTGMNGVGDIEYRATTNVHRNKSTSDNFTISFRSASGYNHGASKVQIAIGDATDGISLNITDAQIILSGASLSDFSCGALCKAWTPSQGKLVLKDEDFNGLAANGGILDLTVNIFVPEDTPDTDNYPLSSNTENGISTGSTEDMYVYESTPPNITKIEIEPLSAGTATIYYGDNISFRAIPQDAGSKIYACNFRIGSLSSTETDCIFTTASLTTEGAKTLYVNATDNVSNTGAPNSSAFTLEILPVETTSQHNLSRPWYNSSYSTIDIGSFTFATTSSDTFAGTCTIIFENATNNAIIGTDSVAHGGTNSITCSDSSVDFPAGLTSVDSMYYVYINVTDSDGDTVTSKKKIFYVCNDLNSSGSGWTCAKADFDLDGATEGIAYKYNSTYVCDNCPNIYNPDQLDSDADGFGNLCSVPTTTDNTTSDTTFWYESPVDIQLSANFPGGSISHINYCYYNLLNESECDPTDPADKISTTDNPKIVTLNCAAASLCQYQLKYYSNSTEGLNEVTKTSNIVNIKNGINITNSTLINSTIDPNCVVEHSTLIRTHLYYDSTLRYGCTVKYSELNDTNATNGEIFYSLIDPTIIFDSWINNSNITNSTVEFSIVRDADFCGAFTVFSAGIDANTLHSGSIAYLGTSYFAPAYLSDICNESSAAYDPTPPTAPIVYDGSLSADIDWFNTNASAAANWFNSTEDISTIYYRYRFIEFNGTDNMTLVNWTSVGINAQVNVTNLSLTEGYNYTFEVMAYNPWGLNSSIAYSDGATLDITAPEAPNVTSSTHPDNMTAYADDDPVFSFDADDIAGSGVESGIQGYSYSLDTSSGTIPDDVLESGTTTQYFNLASGTYYFHVKAKDNAGNFGNTSHYLFIVETEGVGVRIMSPLTGQFFSYTPIDVTVDVDANASVYIVAMHNDGSNYTSSAVQVNATAATGDYTFTGIELENGTNAVYAVANSSEGIVSTSSIIYVIYGATIVPVTNKTLRIGYTSAGSQTNHIVYNSFTGYMLGFATENDDLTIATGSPMSLMTDTEDYTVKVFMTRARNLNKIEVDLDDDEFLDLVHPAFGFDTDVASYLIQNELRYEDVFLSGDDTVQSGTFNLLIRNNGLTSDGRVNLSVSII